MLYYICNNNSYSLDEEYKHYFEKCSDILENIPDTWKQYPHNNVGAVNIIDMEYNEFKKTNSIKDMEHELVHLASACIFALKCINKD